MAADFPIVGEPIFESPVELNDLQSFEKELDSALPAPYRNFLLTSNGRRFLPDGLCIQANKRRWIQFHELYGLHTDSEFHDLRNAQNHYMFRARVPVKYIAIGGGGDWTRIVINISTGSIYVWDTVVPYESDNEVVPTTEWLTKIANTFDEFVERSEAFEP